MRTSWIPAPTGSNNGGGDYGDFSLANIPFGVFSLQSSSSSSSSSSSQQRHCATIVGDTVIDLGMLEEASLFDAATSLTPNTFRGQTTLNIFIAQPKPVWTAVRRCLVELLANDGSDPRLQQNQPLQQAAFYPYDNTVTMHLPMEIQEYTDFYSSREHATNVGIMFRGKDNALQPNWLHLPVGYHGRASTVQVSGHSFHRPRGQLQTNPADASQGSTFGPCRLLDFELEIGTVVGGPPNPLGRAMTLEQAKDRIFGFVLLNDWSARDIQKFEYVPLGPFTSKNFCTTISPWIVPTDALEPFRAATSAGSQSDPVPLPYLNDPSYSSYDVDLFVSILTQQNPTQPHVICKSNFRNLYWNCAQQLVHHSITGCTMNPGDLLGSGTISGSTPDSFGSMLEQSWKGTKEVPLGNGETRKFLRDGDTVIVHGKGSSDLGRVGFGEARATILPPTEQSAGQVPTTTERFTNVKLYGFGRSSSTWRVRIALEAKSIPYETVSIDLDQAENQTPEYLSKNPLGQVPMLECLDSETQQTVRLSQSTAIIDFLEDAFPHRWRLFPSDAVDKAMAKQFVEIVNSGTQPLQNRNYLARLEKLSEGKITVTEEAQRVIERGLSALEVVVKQKKASQKGPYCMGTFCPTIVDVFMVPQLANARRYGLSVDSLFPLLVKIDQTCSTHPWFVKSKVD
mmetsp:Transcript_30384/g.70994  ORF Transcript_30384/g.70994 Transcript_30384/m.70994 type:complete len:681 (-) Transcript_30384:100-2142(-)